MTSASEAQAKAPSSRDARLAVVVLAAGKGTRLGLGAETPPKVLLECLGVPVLEHVRRAIVPLGAGDVVVITGHAAQRVDDWLAASWPEARPVHQIPQQGTGQALRLAMGALDGFEGDVLVVNGDVPQMRASDLAHLLRTHRDAGVAATVLSGIVSDPGQLGRIARDADGTFARIVEAPDAEAATLSIREFNTGLYAFDAAALRPALEDLPRDNAKGEEYLPDAVNRLAAGTGGVQASPSADPRALLGVNTLAELAGAAAILRRRVASAHMANGVFIDDPEHTTIEVDVEIAAGARILPYTHIGRGCRIGPGARVGPFARLRGGTVLEAGAEVGNFVEVKKSTLGPGAKAKHLTYLGDATVQEGANIGCGTVTANYDGKRKHQTVIGKRASIGSGTILVAPVTVGEDAKTGANAVVPAGQDVAPGTVVAGVPARPIEQRKPKPASDGEEVES